MSDKIRKFKENVPGKYYVGEECIGCTLCSEIAPDNFKASLDEELAIGYDYVCKQPADAQEDELCAEAMNSCPANAIGKNEW